MTVVVLRLTLKLLEMHGKLVTLSTVVLLIISLKLRVSLVHRFNLTNMSMAPTFTSWSLVLQSLIRVFRIHSAWVMRLSFCKAPHAKILVSLQLSHNTSMVLESQIVAILTIKSIASLLVTCVILALANLSLLSLNLLITSVNLILDLTSQASMPTLHHIPILDIPLTGAWLLSSNKVSLQPSGWKMLRVHSLITWLLFPTTVGVVQFLLLAHLRVVLIVTSVVSMVLRHSLILRSVMAKHTSQIPLVTCSSSSTVSYNLLVVTTPTLHSLTRLTSLRHPTLDLNSLVTTLVNFARWMTSVSSLTRYAHPSTSDVKVYSTHWRWLRVFLLTWFVQKTTSSFRSTVSFRNLELHMRLLDLESSSLKCLAQDQPLLDSPTLDLTLTWSLQPLCLLWKQVTNLRLTVKNLLVTLLWSNLPTPWSPLNTLDLLRDVTLLHWQRSALVSWILQSSPTLVMVTHHAPTWTWFHPLVSMVVSRHLWVSHALTWRPLVFLICNQSLLSIAWSQMTLLILQALLSTVVEISTTLMRQLMATPLRLLLARLRSLRIL